MPAARPISRAVSTRPALSSTFALREVEAGGTDIAPPGSAPVDDFDGIASRIPRVFLNDDGVGALRHRGAGEYADGFPGTHRALERASRRGIADNGEPDGEGAHIVRAHRVAVHRRDGEGGLRPPRRDIPGENAPERIGKPDLFRRHGPERRQNTVARFRDGDHQRASKVPDRPPDLWTRRISPIRMPRSTALHMS